MFFFVRYIKYSTEETNLVYFTSNPSFLRQTLWASIKDAHLSSPFINTHSSLARFVSGHAQHIFLGAEVAGLVAFMDVRWRRRSGEWWLLQVELTQWQVDTPDERLFTCKAPQNSLKYNRKLQCVSTRRTFPFKVVRDSAFGICQQTHLFSTLGTRALYSLEVYSLSSEWISPKLMVLCLFSSFPTKTVTPLISPARSFFPRVLYRNMSLVCFQCNDHHNTTHIVNPDE